MNDDLNEPLQFSLQLFDNRPEILKKPVQAIHAAIANGTQTRLQRIAFNVMLKNAHKWHAENPNKDRTLYEMSREVLMEAIEYTSQNRKHLKEALKHMQDIKVEWDLLKQDGESIWVSTVLIPTVSFDKDKVYYSYAQEIKPMLLTSKVWAKLDLTIQKRFRLDCSSALYESCTRFRDNPSKLTTELSWEDWRAMIHGQVDKDSSLNEYKYFKRDKLNPAIAEINAVSDLSIELIEVREGRRKIKNLQFLVKEKPQFIAATNVDKWASEWDKKLKAIKVPAKDRVRILSAHTKEEIEAHYLYTMDRVNNTSQEKLISPGRYFVKAIEQGYAKEAAPKAKRVVPEPEYLDTIRKAFEEGRTTEAKSMYWEMSEQDKLELIGEYNESVKDEALRIPEGKKGNSNRYMVAFYMWLAKRTWGGSHHRRIVRIRTA